MANKSLFGSSRGRTVKATDAVNAAGGKAYALSSKQALARYAATGCLSDTFYVNAEDHLDRVIALAKECDSEFVAKLAIFARKEGYMKDMPALLCAVLASRGDNGRAALKAAFPQVIDNGKMLRNFVQMVRSGKLGRKSLGTGPRNLVRGFFERNHPNWLFRQLSVGQDPSGADIVKMVHPKGRTPEHEALLGYMIGRVKAGSEKWDALPPLVQQYEAWKADKSLPSPAVDFQLLTAEKLSGEQWAHIFRNGQWHFIRMNLNTALRHGVLKADPGMEDFIADRLRDREAISKARVMPYQLLAAYKHIAGDVPRKIVDALHDAMEIATENAPVAEGRTLICVDVSGSMRSPITGMKRNPKTGRMEQVASKVRCVDVAALFAASYLRQNRDAAVLPVDTRVHTGYRPEPRNPILTEADRLAQFGGGGTALSLAFAHANKLRLKVDHVVVISDYESWADNSYYSTGTGLMHEWETLRSRNPGAKLVCIDITPGRTHQIAEGHSEILHVSGWSDAVFRVASSFLSGDAGSWLDIIERIDLSSN
jgi:60 kDa SS-A/Ro ribonucleoprotein